LKSRGLELDIHNGEPSPGALVNQTWTAPTTRTTVATQKRANERHALAVPARLTWKDQRGMTRFATVITRNISAHGVFVEALTPIPLSLYRLVHFQLEREDRNTVGIPQELRDGRLLSAVYRVHPATPGRPQGLALRLMVDPKRAMRDQPRESQRATA
jgi:hypothetical protein